MFPWDVACRILLQLVTCHRVNQK